MRLTAALGGDVFSACQGPFGAKDAGAVEFYFFGGQMTAGEEVGVSAPEPKAILLLMAALLPLVAFRKRFAANLGPISRSQIAFALLCAFDETLVRRRPAYPGRRFFCLPQSSPMQSVPAETVLGFKCSAAAFSAAGIRPRKYKPFERRRTRQLNSTLSRI